MGCAYNIRRRRKACGADDLVSARARVRHAHTRNKSKHASKAGRATALPSQQLLCASKDGTFDRENYYVSPADSLNGWDATRLRPPWLHYVKYIPASWFFFLKIYVSV